MPQNEVLGKWLLTEVIRSENDSPDEAVSYLSQ